MMKIGKEAQKTKQTKKQKAGTSAGGLTAQENKQKKES